MIGSFLPWITLGFISVAGTDGDGMITLVAGLVAAIFLLVGAPTGHKAFSGIAVALLAVSALVGVYHLATIEFGSPGAGLFAVIAGAAAGIGFGLTAMMARSPVVTPASSTFAMSDLASPETGSVAPSAAVSHAPPGWHPDPHNPAQWRYWDGIRWTEHVSGGGPVSQ